MIGSLNSINIIVLMNSLLHDVGTVSNIFEIIDANDSNLLEVLLLIFSSESASGYMLYCKFRRPFELNVCKYNFYLKSKYIFLR